MTFAHQVFFTLHDDSQGAREALLERCQRDLAGHTGERNFFVGVRANEQRRAVNDLDFHVALTIVFADKADHDAYQVSPRHKHFVAECQHNWKRVRVFDSIVS
jgi:hypothetical protein